MRQIVLYFLLFLALSGCTRFEDVVRDSFAQLQNVSPNAQAPLVMNFKISDGKYMATVKGRF